MILLFLLLNVFKGYPNYRNFTLKRNDEDANTDKVWANGTEEKESLTEDNKTAN